jgi:DNA polymerase elongation subunit (family B)
VSAKILLLDIETAPNLAYVWGKWEQNVIEFERHWYILSFSVKWLHDKKPQTYVLPDYKAWKSDQENDRDICKHIREYLEQADIVVAHNGDRFDIPKINARLVAHGLTPPDPYVTVDTLKLARTYFKFDSNKLDDLAKYFDIGRKVPHTGARLWLACMRGDAKAWAVMKKYNAHDVELLEKIYLKLRPWSKRHPNLSLFNRKEINCPICESPDTKKSGYSYNRCSKKQRRTCLECGHRFNLGRPVAI